MSNEMPEGPVVFNVRVICNKGALSLVNSEHCHVKWYGKAARYRLASAICVLQEVKLTVRNALLARFFLERGLNEAR